MKPALETMAREFYGYGKWEAPYWFIGLEQGGEGNELRAKAFSKLGKDGLCDCKEFHREIREMRWHREPPEESLLQPTWRRLMLLLMPSLGLDTDQITLRRYQCCRWGRRNSGETSVIDLGGLSAKNLGFPSDRETYRVDRIELIKERIGKCESGPKLVVLYGAGSKKAWNSISGGKFVCGESVKFGSTLFAFMRSPTAPGENDDEWNQLGARIAEQL
jgi:hypothetical protein